MTPAARALTALLDDPELDDPDTEPDRVQRILALRRQHRWPRLVRAILDALADEQQQQVWFDLVAVLQEALELELELPPGRTASRLLHCLQEDPDLDEQLIEGLLEQLLGEGDRDSWCEDPAVLEIA